MTKEEFSQISLMLEKFKEDMVNRIDRHNREFEAMFFTEEVDYESLCGKPWNHNEGDAKNCLECQAVRANV